MIELLNMDCMEYMAGLPDKAFELAIVDPPYGIGAANGAHSNLKELGNKNWDECAPNDAYFRELFRVSKNQLIWGGNYFMLPPTRGFIFWDKHPMPPSYAQGEYCWTSFDINSKKWCGRTGNETPVSHRIHPTQKPVALYEWLLTNYAKPGDRILDTHLGSGSSAIAAHNLGFAFVGMELDADYYAAACKRFEQHKAQSSLFQPDDYDRVTLDYQQQEIL
jgi:site-specific DNA-methyltransferase (adenine-specific)